ncbi:MAG TPA: O-antigen ligase family protein [Pyrinomonadaceae bacterium]|nr:O-antigen ligase family protein [Pyrinomonadaceae bacterium]
MERTAEMERTVASRLIFLTLSVAVVLSALAYGTVHYWSLAVFTTGAAWVSTLWAIDGWRARELRLSRNALQWSILGLLLVGLIQLLPLGSVALTGGVLDMPRRTLSFDPYATKLALVQIADLLIYFAAALVYLNSPRRLRLIVRVICIFGFLLAFYSLIQSFFSPLKIYWIYEPVLAVPFGPFVNRHHFAGYMEMAIALPLGLLFSGAVPRDKYLLYLTAVAVMGIALIMTGSRGGLIGLIALTALLVVLTRLGRQKKDATVEASKRGRVSGAALRAGLGLILVLLFFVGMVLLGGEGALSKFAGTVNAADPSNGRTHIWSVTLRIIADHPFLGTGLGAYGVTYASYETRNDPLRVERAHNDYLEVLADAGIAGAALGLFFIIKLFRIGSKRRESKDAFRRGVATGALAGCFAVLVHSFFDFTLHTTANALLFLILAALATLNGRVEVERDTQGNKLPLQVRKI